MKWIIDRSFVLKLVPPSTAICTGIVLVVGLLFTRADVGIALAAGMLTVTQLAVVVLLSAIT